MHFGVVVVVSRGGGVVAGSDVGGCGFVLHLLILQIEKTGDPSSCPLET